MAYSAQTWADNNVSFPLSAARMAHLESGIGAVDTAKVDKDALLVNAKDHGAVGDGAANDTAALQAWLNTCKSTGRRGFLPAGTYKISTTLSFTQATAWQIAGESASPDGTGAATKLIWAGSSGGTMLLLQGVYQGMLSNILLDGNNIAGIGLDYDAVSSGQVTKNNTIERLSVFRCTNKAVRVGHSAFSTAATAWRDCDFNQGGAAGIGVSIEDANAVWHIFENCEFQSLNIGISAIEAGTGGHFNLAYCRFLGNNFDIKPYTSRASVYIGCQSELSGKFLFAAANQSSHSAVTVIGCTINGTTDAAGVGVFWAYGAPLTLIGCAFLNTTVLPYKIKSQQANTRVNIIGCTFPDTGGPWTTQADEFGPANYIIGSAFDDRADGIVQYSTGELALGSWASPKFALTTTAVGAPTARGAGMVWVQLSSGTVLASGSNKFYCLSLVATGLCGVEVPFIHQIGGSDSVLLGISAHDFNATTTNAVEVNIRLSAGFTLTSKMIFALRFVSQPVTY